ncbi:MAG: hypothetical protein R3F19_25735 [Verrucomicrobiales bacterium]
MINTFRTSDWSAEGRHIEGAARQFAGGGDVLAEEMERGECSQSSMFAAIRV